MTCMRYIQRPPDSGGDRKPTSAVGPRLLTSAALSACGLLLTLVACAGTPVAQPGPTPSPAKTPSPSPSNDAIPEIGKLSAGFDYGFCQGYCHHAIEVTAQTTRMTDTAINNKDKYPDRIITQPTSTETWQNLLKLADWTYFSGLPERIGCPDCADGGAQWLEMTNRGQTHRVTFEPQTGLPQQAELVKALQKIYDDLHAAGRYDEVHIGG